MKVGDRRFYPPHGLVSLVAVEEREFGDHREEFYVLELSRGGNVLLPAPSVGNAALRPLVKPTKAKALLKRLGSRAAVKVDPALDGKARSNLYAEQLKTGDPDHYTEILRDLMVRAATDGISSTDQRLLDTARGYFLEEMGTVLKREPAKLQGEIDTLITKRAAAASAAAAAAKAGGSD